MLSFKCKQVAFSFKVTRIDRFHSKHSFVYIIVMLDWIANFDNIHVSESLRPVKPSSARTNVRF